MKKGGKAVAIKRIDEIMNTQQLVGTIFIAISVIFLILSFRDYSRSKGEKTIAIKIWLRMAFIFAAVGLGLYFLEVVIN